jgi:hypothetical protein
MPKSICPPKSILAPPKVEPNIQELILHLKLILTKHTKLTWMYHQNINYSFLKPYSSRGRSPSNSEFSSELS